MSARWLAASLLLALPSWVRAHDGPPFHLTEQMAGPYKVAVWTDPDIGTGRFWLYVEAPEGGSTEGVTLQVAVAPKSGRLEEVTYPTKRQVDGKRVTYYAEVEFDAGEMWDVRVKADGPAGAGEFMTEVEATPPVGRWGLVLYALPFVLIAGLWVFGILRHRRRMRGGDA